MAKTAKVKSKPLVSNSHNLLKLMIPDLRERQRVAYSIENEGPVHKKVLSALLCKRLFKLVKTIEKTIHSPFVLQPGTELMLQDSESQTFLGIPIPVNPGGNSNRSKIIKAISSAPEHEALVYAIALQVIEWSIGATAKITMDEELGLDD